VGFVVNNGSLLHIGAGSNHLPDWLSSFRETRLDINADCNPDVVASMVDIGEVGTFDVVFCQHALEHLYPHEVGTALNEFYRVLNDGGFALVFVPDLEDARPTDDVLFESDAGSISGLDLYYGFRRALADNPYMAHKTGFVSKTLESALKDAGFKSVAISRLHPYNLMGIGIK
jgi:SAM-dependent methyltransferase